jgi:hypothetical protein
VKAIIRPGDWRIDLLAFRPALIKKGIFDDGIDSSQALWGTWATRPIRSESFWLPLEVRGMESIFHCPSDLMRLTMLTRDTISLLQSASNGEQERQQIDGNYRKQRGWVEAGITTELLPLVAVFSISKGYYSVPRCFLRLYKAWPHVRCAHP